MTTVTEKVEGDSLSDLPLVNKALSLSGSVASLKHSKTMVTWTGQVLRLIL